MSYFSAPVFGGPSEGAGELKFIKLVLSNVLCFFVDLQ